MSKPTTLAAHRDQLRLRLSHLSQREAQDLTHIPRTTINRIINGAVALKIPQMDAIAAALGMAFVMKPVTRRAKTTTNGGLRRKTKHVSRRRRH